MQGQRCEAVWDFLRTGQERLCGAFEVEDGSQRFLRDEWRRTTESGASLTGRGVTAVLEGGGLFERGGVALSDVQGSSLPAAASARHPELAGRPFRALGVSVVMHGRNPHVPTSHMNVRHFSAGDAWWFGGGFDLTPYIVHEEDIIDWHRVAAQTCAPFHAGLYAHARATCDEYFFLRHRGEARGIGGLFYDDLNDRTPQFALSWQRCFELMQTVLGAYCDAYLAVVRRRAAQPTSERERRYQLYRRGRYVEFNLVQDRGTLFGLQSGGRTDAILMSMPPLVQWSYRSPDEGLDSQLLPYLTTLRGKDWLKTKAGV